MPARQRGNTSAGLDIRRLRFRWKRPPAASPQIDRIAQSLEIDAGPAVDRAQHRERLVGRRPAVPGGNEIKAVLHVLAGDGVERTLEPVGEVDPQVLSVEPDGIYRAAGIRRHVDLEGPGQGRDASCIGPLPGGVLPPGDASEQVLGQAPRPVGSDAAVASDDHPLVGRLAAA